MFIGIRLGIAEAIIKQESCLHSPSLSPPSITNLVHISSSLSRMPVRPLSPFTHLFPGTYKSSPCTDCAAHRKHSGELSRLTGLCSWSAGTQRQRNGQ